MSRYPTYVNTVMHNTVQFGDSSDTGLFADRCRELSNGALDFWKLSEKPDPVYKPVDNL